MTTLFVFGSGVAVGLIFGMLAASAAISWSMPWRHFHYVSCTNSVEGDEEYEYEDLDDEDEEYYDSDLPWERN